MSLKRMVLSLPVGAFLFAGCTVGGSGTGTSAGPEGTTFGGSGGQGTGGTGSTGDGVVVERARTDFPTLLAGCGASVSLAGYNTVTELLATGAPAVLVPFADRDETEQATRAAHLAERGLATVVDEATLEPGALARAVDAAEARGRRGVPDIRLDGARETARIVSRLAAAGA